MQNCKVDPNASVQYKIENKTNTDSKPEPKSITDQIRDFRDSLQPGAQLKCNF
jgi:hypothetical protein